MKFSLTKNDKSTAMDEFLLFWLALVILSVGIILVITKPAIGFITASMTVSFGVICIAIFVMFLPCIAWRLATNDKKKKEPKEEKETE